MFGHRKSTGNSFDGDLKEFNDHSDKNMIIYESWINKKGKIHKAMQLRYLVAYTDRKLAYFRKAVDTMPAGYIYLAEVSSINLYLPKQNKNKNKKKRKSMHVPVLDEMKSIDMFDTNLNQTKRKPRSCSLNVKDISLKGDNNTFGFELVSPKRTWIFSCADSQTFEEWINVLRDLCFGTLLHCGYLRKLGGKYKTWRRRFFVIYDVNEIRYFEDDSLLKEKGKIELNKVTKIRATNSNEYHYPFCIQLFTEERTWILATKNKQQQNIWINGIKCIMKQHQRTFVPIHSGFLSLYNTLTHRWHKYYFAIDQSETENRLCCFENQIACKQLQSVTCYGENEFKLVCVTQMRKIISLNELVNVLSIPQFEFKIVNEECKDDMSGLQCIFMIKLCNIEHYLCPHPNNQKNAQKWINIIKNLKCSQRQNIYNKLVKLGYKSSYISSALIQYENFNGTKDYKFNEIKQMIDRMAKPETGGCSNSNTSSYSHSKSPTSPISSTSAIAYKYDKAVNSKHAETWSNNDVLLWIKALENGLIFKIYPDIINGLKKLNINGAQLKKLNAFNFQQLGVDDEIHRALIMEALTALP